MMSIPPLSRPVPGDRFLRRHALFFQAKYAREMGLVGIMFWAPDPDDSTGTLCNEGKSPLMNAAVSAFRTGASVLTSTSSTDDDDALVCFSQTRRVLLHQVSFCSLEQDEDRSFECCSWAQDRLDGGKYFPEERIRSTRHAIHPQSSIRRIGSR